MGDELSYFSFSRILGLGISLIKDDYYFSNELQKENFILEKFKKDYPKEIKNNEKEKTFKPNLKIKEKEERKEVEAKKDIKNKSNELPPLPNLKIKEKEERKEVEAKKEIKN